VASSYTKGNDREASCLGSPDGLSFSNSNVTLPVYDLGIVMVALNGTKFVVIHSSVACATKIASTAPFLSKSLIGNDASKNHVPRAFPLTINSFPTEAPGRGDVTSIRSIEEFVS